MKMKKITMLLLAAGSALCLRAQNPLVSGTMHGIHSYSDSIRIEFPDEQAMMIFEYNNFRIWKDPFQKELTIVRQVLDNIEKSLPSTATPRSVDISVSDNGERTITIREISEPKTQILATEKEMLQLLPPGWEVRINIPVRSQVYLYAREFSGLKQMAGFNPESLTPRMLEESKKVFVSRKRFVTRAIVQKGQLTSSDIKFQTPQDFLSLNGSAGLGYLNSNFYPELNLTLTFQFGNRMNIAKTRLAVTYNNLFFTSRSENGTFQNRTNSFISFSYGRSFGKPNPDGKLTGHTWGSVGAGYLVMKKGDYFTGKTMKFFFSTTAGKFAITPEFYLTNDFKNFQSGLKFVYTF